MGQASDPALDLSTARITRLTVATESWPANIAKATALLHPLGVAVVADEAFDLVVSRHPVTVWWEEIARVLRPGGTYLSQQVIWTVPGFTVDRYRTELRGLHEKIQTDGPFIAHTTRFLIEARKPR